MEKPVGCRFCELYEGRNNIVWERSKGNPDIIFVGEAPGEQEDIQGIPFIGSSGKILDAALDYAKIDNYVITNLVKCRPPHNRKPSAYECTMCGYYLDDQIEEYKPKLIVCLGATSLDYFFKGNSRKITVMTKETTESGAFLEKNGNKFVAVFHPSYVLRGGMAYLDYYELFVKIKEILNVVNCRSCCN